MKIYVDANIFIYATERRDPISRLLVQVLTPNTKADWTILTAEMTLAEVLVKPFRDGDLPLTLQYELLLSGETPIAVSPLTRPIYRLAARLRATNKSLKLPDALHIAAALSTGCTHFLTADDGIKAGLLKQFEAVEESPASRLTIIRPDIPTLDTLLKSAAP